MDAFDIISRLTAGNLNPLTTGPIATVRSATRFVMNMSSQETMKLMQEILVKLKGNPKNKEGSSEIKGFINASKGLMTYVVSILPTCSSSLTIAEVCPHPPPPIALVT